MHRALQIAIWSLDVLLLRLPSIAFVAKLASFPKKSLLNHPSLNERYWGIQQKSYRSFSKIADPI